MRLLATLTCILLACTTDALFSPVAAQDAPYVVIVGGREGLSPTVSSPLSAGRYWVVLGTMDDGGTLSALSPDSCASTQVAFSLSVPEKPGMSAPSDTVRGIFVPGTVLQGWRGTSTQMPSLYVTASTALQGATSRMYCVAYTSPRLAADMTASQIITARVVPKREMMGEQSTYVSAMSARLTGSAIGGTFEFSPRRVAPRVEAQMGIRIASIERGYGFAGALMEGSHAVLLAARDTFGTAWRLPTARECLSTEVQFELRVPEKAGVAPLATKAQAFWESGSRAESIFPDGSGVGGYGPPYCIAEVPVRLSASVGLQYVTAAVVVSDTSPRVSIGGVPIPARSEPDQHWVYDPIRAHARPRPFFSVALANGGLFNTDSTAATEVASLTEASAKLGDASASARSGSAVEDDAEEDVDLITMAGFDFAIEPVLGPIFGSLNGSFLQGFRLALATNVGTGEFGDIVYLGLSLPSASNVLRPSRSSIGSTASPVDVTLGASFRREDWKPFVTMALSLSLGDALSALSKVFGVP